MKLEMGKVEGLQFILFSTLAMEALLTYALTNEEGTELSGFLLGLLNVMLVNGVFLLLFALYEYILKPAIFRPTTRNQASDSVVGPNSDAFSFESSSNVINAL